MSDIRTGATPMSLKAETGYFVMMGTPTNSPSANNAIQIYSGLSTAGTITQQDAEAHKDAFVLLTADDNLSYYEASLANDNWDLPDKYKILGRDTFRVAVAGILKERTIAKELAAREPVVTWVTVAAELRQWLPWVVAAAAAAYALWEPGGKPGLDV